MHIEFHGGADEVTGSPHRIHVDGVDVLLDCGLFQGHRAEVNRLNREIPRWAIEADCLVLSHAHIEAGFANVVQGRRGARTER
jgi:metallo-beta-lactamase family protein